MNAIRFLSISAALLTLSSAFAEGSVDISFKSGDATIASTLYLPEGKGPFPAIVLVHGSGGGIRDMKLYQMDKDFFLKNKLAVLLYDKRGSGQSTGEWTDAKGIQPLVEDVENAVSMLRKRPEIKPDKIGLRGVSQGGWVVTFVGAKDPKLAFIISVSGPGGDGLEQGLYQRGQVLLDRGVPLPAVEKVNGLRKQVWDYYATGQGYEEADKAWEAAKKEPWFAEAKQNAESHVTKPADLGSLEYYRNAKFDMYSAIKGLKVPVLAVFGARDRYIPVLDSVAKWERALDDGHVKDATIRVFLNAGHGIQLEEREFPPVLVGEDHIKMMQGMNLTPAPGYHELVSSWLKKYIG